MKALGEEVRLLNNRVAEVVDSVRTCNSKLDHNNIILAQMDNRIKTLELLISNSTSPPPCQCTQAKLGNQITKHINMKQNSKVSEQFNPTSLNLVKSPTPTQP